MKPQIWIVEEEDGHNEEKDRKDIDKQWASWLFWSLKILHSDTI